MAVEIRPAVEADETAVRRVLNGANLTVPETLGTPSQAVFVAETQTLVGSLVASVREADCHVEAIAVTRNRRGQGIGSALLARLVAVTDRPVTARFRPALGPFYESAGFEVTTTDNDRLRGVCR